MQSPPNKKRKEKHESDLHKKLCPQVIEYSLGNFLQFSEIMDLATISSEMNKYAYKALPIAGQKYELRLKETHNPRYDTLIINASSKLLLSNYHLTPTLKKLITIKAVSRILCYNLYFTTVMTYLTHLKTLNLEILTLYETKSNSALFHILKYGAHTNPSVFEKIQNLTLGAREFHPLLDIGTNVSVSPPPFDTTLDSDYDIKDWKLPNLEILKLQTLSTNAMQKFQK